MLSKLRKRIHRALGRTTRTERLFDRAHRSVANSESAAAEARPLCIAVVHNSGGRFGHQMKDVMTAFILAEWFGFEYVYEDYDYLKFMAYGEHEQNIRDLPDDIVPVIVEEKAWRGLDFDRVMALFGSYDDRRAQFPNNILLLSRATRVHLFQVWQWQREGRLNRDIFNSVRDQLIEKFTAAHAVDRDYFDADRVNVAFHVRRGDLDTAESRARFSRPEQNHYVFSVDLCQRLIAGIESALSEHAPSIHLYSEVENSEDIQTAFAEGPVQLHIGRPLEEDMLHLIRADVLVMSNSSFSTLAGYYSRGTKLYHPNDQCHGLPESEFLAFDADGNFDGAKLRNQVVAQRAFNR